MELAGRPARRVAPGTGPEQRPGKPDRRGRAPTRSDLYKLVTTVKLPRTTLTPGLENWAG